MPDAFTTALVGGLLFMAIMILVFSSTVTPYTACCKAYAYAKPVMIKNISGAQLVGYSEINTAKFFDFSFDVSNLEQTRIHSLGNFTVYSGLLFGSNSIKYTMQKPESLSIGFRISGTNGYGNLVIKVDDIAVFSEKTNPGEYNIELKLGRDIEILTTSSDWRIWAPSVYELENVKLTAKSYFSQQMNYVFPVDEIYTHGEIRLSFNEAIGQFIVDLNSENIFYGNVRDYETISFNRMARENLLVLRAARDSRFSGNAQVVVYYIIPQENRFEMIFEIDDTQYEKLPGEVNFEIVSLERYGGVSVKLISDDTLLYSDYQRADEGLHSFSFGKNNVRIGENKLIIESVDGGIFYVKDVEVLA